MDPKHPSMFQSPSFNIKASAVEACRICLATDVKMYCLQGTQLGHCMDCITGLNQSFGGLPNYVCYQCAPILIKCNKLIEKSRKAQSTFKDIFIKNGEITKSLIEEQNRPQLDLQSPLDSYLLINYFYIKYDDDNNTSDFIETQADPNERINIKLKNEIKEESFDEETDFLDFVKYSKIIETEKSDMKKEITKDCDSDSDVESVEIQNSIIHISSDEEKNDDNFISLKPYEETRGKQAKKLLPKKYKYREKPKYGIPKVKGKERGKKKKSTNIRNTANLSDLVRVTHDTDLNKFFDILQIAVPKTPNVKYTCKLCRKVFRNRDDAKDHRLLGCKHNRQIAINASSLSSSEPLIWEDWKGNE